MSGADRKILMVVPHRVRDLEGHALVAWHLQRKYGHDVEFSGVDQVEERLLESAPDALVLEYLGWFGRMRVARLAKELNVRVALLSISGLYETKEEFAREAGKLTGANPFLDCYLSWGEAGRRAVLEEGLLPNDRIHTTGCPRFDLYCPPYLSLMRPKVELLRDLSVSDPSAPFILWTTNTPSATSDEELHVHAGRTHRNLPEEEVRSSFHDERRQFLANCEVFGSLARRHPDWNFVIKVHPVEPMSAYVELAAGLPNVRVIHDAPVRDFLFHCDVLLQRGCTTATEAWMLGKPVLELETEPYRFAWAPKEFRDGNRVVGSLDEADESLVEMVRDGSIPVEQQRAREAFLEEFFYRVDGKASERVALRLHELVSPPSYTAADQSRTRELFRSILQRRETIAASRWENRLKDAFGIPRRTSLRFWKRRQRPKPAAESREISREMVEELWNRYDRILAGAAPGTAAREATGS
jgi:surface carbohydrate biosynthesis protein